MLKITENKFCISSVENR